MDQNLNAALEGEMDAHLTEEERQMGNRRNGKMQKQVQTPLGEVTVSTPRDRNSGYFPIKGRKHRLYQTRAYLLLAAQLPCSCYSQNQILLSYKKNVLAKLIFYSLLTQFYLHPL